MQNIIDNLHGRVKKKQVEKITEGLVEEKVLTVKEYGKSKIFMINQEIFPQVDQAVLNELDEQIRIRKEEVSALQTELKKLTDELKENTTELTNEQIEEELARLEKKNKEMQGTLNGFKAKDVKIVTEEEMQKAETRLKKYQTEWRKRKRGCMDILDIISESMDMTSSICSDENWSCGKTLFSSS